jgi:hypothetical protein
VRGEELRAAVHGLHHALELARQDVGLVGLREGLTDGNRAQGSE